MGIKSRQINKGRGRPLNGGQPRPCCYRYVFNRFLPCIYGKGKCFGTLPDKRIFLRLNGLEFLLSTRLKMGCFFAGSVYNKKATCERKLFLRKRGGCFVFGLAVEAEGKESYYAGELYAL